MSNKIQIKRSVANSVVTGLANGELAYTSNGEVLFIGAPNGNGESIAIGGIRKPGILTANQALVANGASGIDKIITANLTTQELWANGGAGSSGYVLASGGAGGNVYWLSSGSLSINVDSQYTWSNVHTHNANLVANSNLIINAGGDILITNGAGIQANGTWGSAGDALLSDGSGNLYYGSPYNANNASYLGTKSEGNLNVNSATSAVNANNASYLGTKSEGNLNVNSATSAVNANNSTYVGSNTVADIVTLAVANTQSNNNTFTGNNIFQGNTDFKGQIANNFIPTANNTYSLGNSSMRWANLYLSGSTIVLGNSNISDTANGVTIANFESTSNAFFANVQISSYIVSNATPGTNTTFYLGTSTNWWANAFIGGITANTGSFSGDVTVGGNLVVHGNVTTTDVQSVIVSDPLIFLAGNNVSSDTLDIGFAGQYYDGYQRWTGLFRDVQDSGIYKLFYNTRQDLTSNNIVDTNNADYRTATLKTYLLSGGLVANSSNVQITANSTYGVNIVGNTLTLTSALNVNSGGTGQSSYTAGDLLYASSQYVLGTVSVPGSAANGQVLQIVNNLPAYGTLDGGLF
jgi:hypothetical protein